MQLNPEAKAPILSFVGPPGVGKTSLGQSIARAMGRKFERMSLGGLHDESELRGHRRTYIGAMPGRILQGVRRSGVTNPILMLDEIDKLGRDFRGDPAAALMEVLDPAQNKEFRDNYLNLAYDLSKVLFITTANTLEGIPRPLLDRMEVLELSGYSDMEKQAIARQYLIPRQRAEAGLAEEQLDIADEALRYIIRRHTREAGVRELERVIGGIARKRARQVVEEQDVKGSITVQSLADLLGPEKFKSDNGRQNLAPGVAAGLAWTEAGGDVLYVEATLTQKDEKVTLTGHLGQVMQESAKAARSYIWSIADQIGLDRAKIEERGVHIHVPAGAVPKDGPSAGVTMATALVSAYCAKPVHDKLAMTGELTLSGLVLPVGGIKEKILAGAPRRAQPRDPAQGQRSGSAQAAGGGAGRNEHHPGQRPERGSARSNRLLAHHSPRNSTPNFATWARMTRLISCAILRRLHFSTDFNRGTDYERRRYLEYHHEHAHGRTERNAGVADRRRHANWHDEKSPRRGRGDGRHRGRQFTVLEREYHHSHAHDAGIQRDLGWR